MINKINKIIGVSDSLDSPKVLLEIVLDKNRLKEVGREMLSLHNNDICYDWFNEYFQITMADRINKKQDFTPVGVGSLLCRIAGVTDGIISEICCGTGSIFVQHYNMVMKKYSPFTLNPMDRGYYFEELSDKTIPFLLFNMAIRGVNGIVVECDVLTRETKNAYTITNKNNDCLAFSEVDRIVDENKKKELAKIYNLKWAEEKLC